MEICTPDCLLLRKTKASFFLADRKVELGERKIPFKEEKIKIIPMAEGLKNLHDILE